MALQGVPTWQEIEASETYAGFDEAQRAAAQKRWLSAVYSQMQEQLGAQADPAALAETVTAKYNFDAAAIQEVLGTGQSMRFPVDGARRVVAPTNADSALPSAAPPPPAAVPAASGSMPFPIDGARSVVERKAAESAKNAESATPRGLPDLFQRTAEIETRRKLKSLLPEDAGDNPVEWLANEVDGMARHSDELKSSAFVRVQEQLRAVKSVTMYDDRYRQLPDEKKKELLGLFQDLSTAIERGKARPDDLPLMQEAARGLGRFWMNYYAGTAAGLTMAVTGGKVGRETFKGVQAVVGEDMQPSRAGTKEWSANWWASNVAEGTPSLLTSMAGAAVAPMIGLPAFVGWAGPAGLAAFGGSFGSTYERAKEQGAGDGKAYAKALTKGLTDAGIEIMSERISYGSWGQKTMAALKGGAKDQALAIAERTLMQKFRQVAAQSGVAWTSEFVEELVANTGQDLTSAITGDSKLLAAFNGDTEALAEFASELKAAFAGTAATALFGGGGEIMTIARSSASNWNANAARLMDSAGLKTSAVRNALNGGVYASLAGNQEQVAREIAALAKMITENKGLAGEAGAALNMLVATAEANGMKETVAPGGEGSELAQRLVGKPIDGTDYVIEGVDGATGLKVRNTKTGKLETLGAKELAALRKGVTETGERQQRIAAVDQSGRSAPPVYGGVEQMSAAGREVQNKAKYEDGRLVVERDGKKLYLGEMTPWGYEAFDNPNGKGDPVYLHPESMAAQTAPQAAAGQAEQATETVDPAMTEEVRAAERGLVDLANSLNRYRKEQGMAPLAIDELKRVDLDQAGDEAKAVDEVARSMGYKTIFYEGDPQRVMNGAASSDGETIFLNVNSTRPLLAIAGHEVTHKLKDSDPEAFQIFADVVVGQLENVEGVSKLIHDAQAKAGKDLDNAAILEEIAADAMGDMWLDSKFWDELAARTDPTMFRKVVDLVLEVVEKIKSGFKGEKSVLKLNDVDGVRAAALAALERRVQVKQADLEQAAVESEGGKAVDGSGPVSAVAPDSVRYPIQYARTKDLKIDPKRFQFKGLTGEGGVRSADRLAGPWDETAGGVVHVWEDKNGKQFVVNGHHRFDLANREGVEYLAVQIFREKDGISPARAKQIGAEINIKEGKGSIEDYVDFYRNTQYTEAEAKKRGLLQGAKAVDGFRIGRYASDDLYSAFKAGKITAEKAGAIANIARADEGLQRYGLQQALTQNIPAGLLAEQMRAFARRRATPQMKDVDLFGMDDSVMKEAASEARAARAIKDELGEDRRILHQALKRGNALELTEPQADRYGITDRKSEAQISKALERVERDLARWENWNTDSELYRQVRERAGLDVVDESPVAPESPPAAVPVPGREQGAAPETEPKAAAEPGSEPVQNLQDQSEAKTATAKEQAQGVDVTFDSIADRKAAMDAYAKTRSSQRGKQTNVRRKEIIDGDDAFEKFQIGDETFVARGLAVTIPADMVENWNLSQGSTGEYRIKQPPAAAPQAQPAPAAPRPGGDLFGEQDMPFIDERQGGGEMKMSAPYGDKGLTVAEGAEEIYTRTESEVANVDEETIQAREPSAQFEFISMLPLFQAAQQAEGAAVSADGGKTGAGNGSPVGLGWTGVKSAIRDRLTKVGVLSIAKDAKVLSPVDAAEILWEIRNPVQEKLVLLPLDDDMNVMPAGAVVVSIGLLDRSQAHFREVYRAMRATGGTKFVLAHNHPSGDPTPSSQDIQMTKSIINGLAKLGVGDAFVDHVIINGDKFFSYQEMSMMGYERKAGAAELPISLMGSFGAGTESDYVVENLSPVWEIERLNGPNDTARIAATLIGHDNLGATAVVGINPKNAISSYRLLDRSQPVDWPAVMREIIAAPGTARVVVSFTTSANDPTPTARDMQDYNAIREISKATGIELLDVVVVGGNQDQRVSFYKEGMIKKEDSDNGMNEAQPFYEAEQFQAQMGLARARTLASSVVEQVRLFPEWVRNGAANIIKAIDANEMTDPQEAYNRVQALIDASGKQMKRIVAKPGKSQSQPDLFGEKTDPGMLFSAPVSAARDAEYLAAVEAGDMEAAQRMVDEAAKAAGYDVLAFKGMPSKAWKTGKEITVIQSANGDWAGFLSSDKDVAEKFRQAFATMGEAKTVTAYLDMRGATEVDAEGGKARDFQFDHVNRASRRNDMLDMINKSEFGVVVKNTEDEATVYVPKRSSQVKSADPVTRDDAGNVIPLSERFNERSDDIRFSAPVSALGFSSAVYDAIDSMEFHTIPSDQLKARTNKTQGVKQEELDDLGLFDWLDGVDGKVSKDQVLDFIAQGGPKIQEVTKGVGLSQLFDVITADGYEVLEAVTREEAEAYKEQNSTSDDPLSVRQLSELPAFRDQATKHEKWQLPGGENYREVLLTLPEAGGDIYTVERRGEGISVVNRFSGEQVQSYPASNPMSQKLAESYQDTLNDKHGPATAYNSSHWDELNPLAHVRLNDRTDADGNRVLFIEEVQSDWHQAGRKKGYRNNVYNVLLDDGSRLANGVSKSEAERLVSENSGARIVETKTFDGDSYGVPNAPFKKSWQMLAFKRVLRMAAEQGYDAVAWTPGEVQAERYDLSKQLDQVSVSKTGNDEYHLSAFDKNQSRVYDQEDLSGEALADYIGKELAERAIKDTASGYAIQNYSGLDLKVGGEGMKGFYDRMLPSEIGKYIRKLDKTAKVGTTSVHVGTTGTLENTTEIEPGVRRGNYKQSTKMAEVWSVPITPAVRDKVLGGQYMYSAPTVENDADMDYRVEGKAEKLWAWMKEYFTPAQGVVPWLAELNRRRMARLDSKKAYIRRRRQNLDAALKRLDRATGKESEAVRDALMAYMNGTLDLFGLSALNKNAVKYADIVDGVRAEIDANSAALARISGLADTMRLTVEQNKGRYVTRVYRRELQPGYKPKKADAQAAADYVRQNIVGYVEGWTRRMARHLGQLGDSRTRRLMIDYMLTGNSAILDELAAVEPSTIQPDLAGAVDVEDYGQRLVNVAGYLRTAHDAIMRRFDSELDLNFNPDNGGVEAVFNADHVTSMVKGTLDKILTKNLASSAVGNSEETKWAVDQKSLQRRKDIPVEIRRFMGEVVDLANAYQATAARQTQMLNAAKFLDEVARMDEQFDVESDNRLFYGQAVANASGRYVHQIPEDKAAYGALAGKYTDRATAAMLRNVATGGNTNVFLRSWMKALGTFRYSKVMLNPATHARNALANTFFHISNADLLHPVSYGRAVVDVVGLLKGVASQDTAARKTWERLLETGVLSGSAHGQVMHEDMKDALKGVDGAMNPQNMLSALSKGMGRNIASLYAMGDNVPKLISFYATLNRFDARIRQEVKAAAGTEAAYEGLTEAYRIESVDGDQVAFTDKRGVRRTMTMDEFVEREAYMRVVATHPDYNRLPKIVTDVMRRAPVGPDFIAFDVESARVAYNNWRLAWRELTVRRDITPLLGTIVGQSFSGLMASSKYMAASWAVRAMLRALGTEPPDREEEHALRGLQNEWYQDNPAVWWKNDDGTWSMLDIGYLQPYNVPRFFSMSMQAEPGKRMDAFARQVAEQYLTVPMATKAFSEAVMGLDEYGRPLADSGESWGSNLADRIDHMLNEIAPGGAIEAQRAYEVWKAKQPLVDRRSGEVRTVGSHLTKAVQPLQIRKYSPQQMLESAARDTAAAVHRWKMEASREYREGWNAYVSEEDADKIVASTVRKLEKVATPRLDDIVKYARVLDLTEDEIYNALRQAGFGKNDLDTYFESGYLPYNLPEM